MGHVRTAQYHSPLTSQDHPCIRDGSED